MTTNGIDRTPFFPRRATTLMIVALLAVFCGGASSENRAGRHPRPRPVGALGPGFYDPAAPPPPEGTIHPTPGSWDAVHPPRGYRVALLTAGNDPATLTLVRAVRQWADVEHVRLETVAVTDPYRMVDGMVEAIELKTDLIITAGHTLVDPLALVTASYLEQPFLVVGAQLPEPTVNVTAAIWRGAATRGGEVPDTAHSFDPAAFTAERAGAAVRAGVASVLHHLTGIVVSLD